MTRPLVSSWRLVQQLISNTEHNLMIQFYPPGHIVLPLSLAKNYTRLLEISMNACPLLRDRGLGSPWSYMPTFRPLVASDPQKGRGPKREERDCSRTDRAGGLCLRAAEGTVQAKSGAAESLWDLRWAGTSRSWGGTPAPQGSGLTGEHGEPRPRAWSQVSALMSSLHNRRCCF